MNFAEALDYALYDNCHIAREGWNGKGMFVFLVKEWTYFDLDSYNEHYETVSFLALKTAKDKVVPWNASQEDVTAKDWTIV